MVNVLKLELAHMILKEHESNKAIELIKKSALKRKKTLKRIDMDKLLNKMRKKVKKTISKIELELILYKISRDYTESLDDVCFFFPDFTDAIISKHINLRQTKSGVKFDFQKIKEDIRMHEKNFDCIDKMVEKVSNLYFI